jgi:hypothetical protein
MLGLSLTLLIGGGLIAFVLAMLSRSLVWIWKRIAHGPNPPMPAFRRTFGYCLIPTSLMMLAVGRAWYDQPPSNILWSLTVNSDAEKAATALVWTLLMFGPGLLFIAWAALLLLKPSGLLARPST